MFQGVVAFHAIGLGFFKPFSHGQVYNIARAVEGFNQGGNLLLYEVLSLVCFQRCVLRIVQL